MDSMLLYNPSKLNKMRISKDDCDLYFAPPEPMGPPQSIEKSKKSTVRSSTIDNSFYGSSRLLPVQSVKIVNSAVTFKHYIPTRWYDIEMHNNRGSKKKVQRRYTDFESMHIYLLDKYPKRFAFVPFTPKSIAEIKDNRSIGLQNWLEYMCNQMHCTELHNWLQYQNY
jgi:hypothetical protein